MVRVMWAITVPSPGGPDALTWAQVSDPAARPGHVVVDVAAAGVNRADLLQREGRYPPPPGAPDVPGLECAGVISEVGTDVARWRVGDRVCALLGGGGYAQRVAVPAGQLLPAPRGVELSKAAAFPEAACTVWSTVFDAGRLRSGESLLVHGGTSGIGTLAVQLANASDVRVFATAGSERKCARAVELGAEVAINYKDDDFARVVRDLTHGRGVDVVLDVVGGPYLERNLEALAPDGRLIVIATQGGRRGELDFRTVMAKRATIYAAGLRARPAEQKAAIVAAVREHVWPLIEAGRITPVIEAEVPLRDAARAHQILEEGQHIGKVLLTV